MFLGVVSDKNTFVAQASTYDGLTLFNEFTRVKNSIRDTRNVVEKFKSPMVRNTYVSLLTNFDNMIDKANKEAEIILEMQREEERKKIRELQEKEELEHVQLMASAEIVKIQRSMFDFELQKELEKQTIGLGSAGSIKKNSKRKTELEMLTSAVIKTRSSLRNLESSIASSVLRKRRKVMA